MPKLACLAFALLIGCSSKSEPTPAPKPVDEPKPAPAKVEPEPAPAPTADKPAAPPAEGKTAPEGDQKLIGAVDDQTKFVFKPADGTFLEVEVKPRVANGRIVVDVISAGKVIDTLESGVKKDDFQMEVKAKIGIALREGVLAVVTASKTTGKPADFYKARVYTWNDSTKKLEPGRKIELDDIYDPAADL